MENFESTLKDLVWKLIQEEVKVEVTRQLHTELTESDNDNERLTEDRVNELIGEYINYNVSVSIEAWTMIHAIQTLINWIQGRPSSALEDLLGGIALFVILIVGFFLLYGAAVL